MREFSPDRKLLERAEALTEIDRWEEAIPVFSRYLLQEPDSFRANAFLSACFYHVKNTKQALQYAETAIRFKPEDEWGHRLRSLALSQTKRHKEALVSATEAVRLAPQEPLAIQRLMHAYLNCHKTKEALAEGEKLRSLQPEKEDGIITMGYILMEKRRYKEAQELLYQALKINPRSSAALINLGVIHLRQKDEEKAFEFFLQAVQADPKDKLAQNNLKLTIKTTPIWQTVLIYLAVTIIFPPAFIGLIFYLASNHHKMRRFRKLPPSIQESLKSQNKRFRSFSDFLNSPTTLRVTKVLFFLFIFITLFSVIIIVIAGINSSKPVLGEILLMIKNLAILGLMTFPFGLFWLFLRKRTKNLY